MIAGRADLEEMMLGGRERKEVFAISAGEEELEIRIWEGLPAERV